MKMSFNNEQRKVIENQEGFVLVDAGAGTGKTHTIVERYQQILKKNNYKASKTLLVTFTVNAAENMREKIISQAKPQYTSELLSAPIQTFDSFCMNVVKNYGTQSFSFLGIEQNINDFQLVTDVTIQKNLFSKFYNLNENKYLKLCPYLISQVQSPLELFKLIENSLCAGILPTSSAWYLNSKEKLRANTSELKSLLEELNNPQFHKKQNDKQVQNQAIKIIANNLKERRYSAREELLITDTKISLRTDFIENFKVENQDELIEEFRIIFFDFLVYMAKHRKVTFSMISVLCFLTLLNIPAVRKNIGFEYIMIDEFQDTNEIQFLITMLCLKKANLCVVGDWKQGIYGFRYADIENIQNFGNKIKQYNQMILNYTKVAISIPQEIIQVYFTINYRSSQKILDFSSYAFLLKEKEESIHASNYDINNNEERKKYFSQNKITLLKQNPNMTFENTSVNLFVSNKEIDATLLKIKHLVNNKYKIKTKEGEKNITFADIAILSRKVSLCSAVQKAAPKFNIPVFYTGGLPFFNKPGPILCLAWLEVLCNKNSKEPWVTICDSYNIPHGKIIKISKFFEFKKLPEEMQREYFAKKKRYQELKYSIISWLTSLMTSYNLNDKLLASFLQWLSSVIYQNHLSLPQTTVILRQAFENKIVIPQSNDIENNSVTVQTIHAAKGLEYPVVFIIGVNNGSFPSSVTNKDSLVFHSKTGLWAKKFFDNMQGILFNKMASDLIFSQYNKDAQEERRLFYVAMTRAKQDLFISSQIKKSSKFFKHIQDLSQLVVEQVILEDIDEKNKPNPAKAIGAKNIQLNLNLTSTDYRRMLSPHDIMQLDFSQTGRGAQFGTEAHFYIQKYIHSDETSVPIDFQKDFDHAKQFVDDNKPANFQTEIESFLPVNKERGFSGIIDLLIITNDTIKIVDWKTDITEINLLEYSKQLSVYFHTLKAIEKYKNKKIKAIIFWTYTGRVSLVNPMKLQDLKA